MWPGDGAIVKAFDRETKRSRVRLPAAPLGQVVLVQTMCLCHHAEQFGTSRRAATACG